MTKRHIDFGPKNKIQKKDLKKYTVPCHPFYAGICPLYHIFAGKRFQED